MDSPDQPREPLPPEASARAIRLVFAAVFALALAVRLAYTFEIRDLPTLHELVMDAQRYDQLARDVLDHGWRPREAFYQAPLYPYLLAAVYAVSGRSLTAMRLAQALVGALTAALTARAAGRLWERAAAWQAVAAAAIAGTLAALYAPAVFYTPLLLKTVPVLFLESAALVLLLPPAGRGLSPARALAAGAALGGAALLQESLLLLAPAAALYVALAGEDEPEDVETPEAERPRQASRRHPQGWQPTGRAFALLAGATLALAPAALLNYAASGEVLLTSSQGGMNFYIGNARGATGTYAALSSGSQVPERQRADAGRLAAAFASRERGRAVAPGELDPAEVSRLFWRETWREIAADPGAWLRLLVRKARLFWNAYELPDAEGFRVYRRESLLLRCDPVVFGVVAPLAAVGLLALARGGRLRRRRALLPALLAGTACAAVVAFFVFGRYRLAALPFLLPLAAAGVLELIAVSTRARAASVGTAARPALDLALLAAAGLAVNVPCLSAAEVRQQDAVIEYNLGVAANRWSGAAGAESQRLAAAAHGQPSPAARASLDRAVSRASRAIAYLEEAARDSPGFLAAEIEWAIARQGRGSYLAAAGGYAQAAADYLGAKERLVAAMERLEAAMAPGASEGPAGSQSRGGGGDDPELVKEGRRLLASLDSGAAAATNDLGVQLIAAGQLDRAEAVLTHAAAIAPSQPEPRGSLALCRFQRGLAARRRGDRPEAARLFAASRDGYREAVRLAESTGRTDLATLYRRGQAAAEAELSREPHPPG
ncbi:MAG TPA: glycosyltransferase family 39 protein [Thermoanaerobaculia bacterium]|nr:glycosyltransferase family 39 protein [Thermoanaerobaculia bacterium]